MINTPTPIPTRPGPLTARPVDRTSTTRRSRLADGQVPHLIRSVWDDLTPRQRQNVIDFAVAMESWDDLTTERRDELLAERLARFERENEGRVESIRRRNAITEAQEAAAEEKLASQTTASITSLETRAAVATLHHAGWAAMCDGCGGWRSVRSSRPVARSCDQCEASRQREQAKRRRLAERAA